MSTVATTLRLAEQLGLDPGAALLDGPWATVDLLTEWSLNTRDDARGALRFGTWFEAGDPAVDAFVARRTCPALSALRARLPLPTSEGVGLSFRPDRPPSARWWQLARDGEGPALWAAASDAWPAFAPLGGLLARIGGPERAVAIGADAEAGALVRSTFYVALPTPRSALEALDELGVEASEGARRFMRALVGWDEVVAGAREWPKLWLGRSYDSEGAGAGLKLYHFIRGMQRPPSEDELIALVRPSEVVARLWRDEAARGNACRIVGLTLPERAPADPRWTVYLAPR
ncbi:MAG: hypothetical protein IT385_14185 [Deltaproteobacteria bacterium]|nr:hypothetical protein [Deltaproteobacteria bacterium]